MPTAVVLGPGDEPELERFLVEHADSSMFLRANLRSAGLVDEGKPHQATYLAVRDGETMIAVAAHCWNGVVLVQGRAADLARAARAAVEQTRRAVSGFSGPFAQVVAAREALGMQGCRAKVDSREDLFALALDELRVPPPLADGSWLCRRPVADDVPELVRWGVAYGVEALGDADTPELHEQTREQLARNKSKWVLVVDGERVAMSGFNAQLPDTVQVGGVYTPPSLRRRGYARAVVAGSLLDARSHGATRSTLFTQADNVAARTAYLALGYRIVGDYGLVLL
jgi:ribosomal protein S18 acetylase RimI-like enzyme